MGNHQRRLVLCHALQLSLNGALIGGVHKGMPVVTIELANRPAYPAGQRNPSNVAGFAALDGGAGEALMFCGFYAYTIIFLVLLNTLKYSVQNNY